MTRVFSVVGGRARARTRGVGFLALFAFFSFGIYLQRGLSRRRLAEPWIMWKLLAFIKLEGSLPLLFFCSVCPPAWCCLLLGPLTGHAAGLPSLKAF